jgi:prefoldin alpha subunit
MSDNEKDQGKIIMYQILQAEMGQLKKQAVMIDNRMLDLETTEHALDEMREFSKDNESLVPVGSGCYVKGSVKASGVLLDIGAGVMVERDLKSASSFIKERKKEIEDAGRKLQVQMEGVVNNINELTPEIQKIVAEQQGHKH